MPTFNKPDARDVNKVWASTAPAENIQTPPDTYVFKGWTQAKPPFEYFNWSLNLLHGYVAYVNQRGIPEWDDRTTYTADSSFIQYGGVLFKCIKTNTNKPPHASPDCWKSYVEGYFPVSVQNGGTGAQNADQARSNLGLNFAAQMKRDLANWRELWPFDDTVVTSRQFVDMRNALGVSAFAWVYNDSNPYNLNDFGDGDKTTVSKASLKGVWDKVRPLSNSFEDGDGNLYVRSRKGTQFRLNFDYFDFYGASGEPVFTISKDGEVIRGKVPFDRLTNVPWELRNIKPIGTSGQLNDGYGVLDKRHGGTGRDDGNADFGYLDTDTVNLRKGSEGGLRFSSAPNGGEKNKIYAGQDNGTDINRPANINLDTWFGVSIGSTINNNFSWIHDARNGDTRQRGDMVLGEGQSGIRSVISRGGDLHLRNGAGDTLRIESGNSFAQVNANGEVRFRVANGVVTTGGVPVERVTGAGTAITRNVSNEAFNIEGIKYTTELAQLGHVKTVLDNIDWKYGAFKGKGVYDSGSARDIPWGAGLIPTTGVVRAVSDVANSTQDNVFNLTRSMSKWYRELKGASDEVLSTAQFMNAFQDLTGDNSINGLVFGVKANREGWGDVQYQETMPGRLLTPSNCAGDTGSRGRLDGTYKCLGHVKGVWDSSGGIHRTALWQKVGY